MTAAGASGGCLASFSACTRASTPNCSAISDRSRSSADSRPFRAAICRRMSSALAIVSCPFSWKLPVAAGRRATRRLYKVAPDGENRNDAPWWPNQASQALDCRWGLQASVAEPSRLSSLRPPQCGVHRRQPACSPSAAKSAGAPLGGPRVRIRFPPAGSPVRT